MRDATQAVAVGQHRVQHQDARRHGQQQLVQFGQRARGEDGFAQAEFLDVLGDGVAPVPMIVDDDDGHGAGQASDVADVA